jgi:hypothetical protein
MALEFRRGIDTWRAWSGPFTVIASDGYSKLCHFSRQSRVVLEWLSEPFGRLLSKAPMRRARF